MCCIHSLALRGLGLRKRGRGFKANFKSKLLNSKSTNPADYDSLPHAWGFSLSPLCSTLLSVILFLLCSVEASICTSQEPAVQGATSCAHPCLFLPLWLILPFASATPPPALPPAQIALHGLFLQSSSSQSPNKSSLSPMLTLSLNISETKRPKPLPNPCPLSLFLDQEYPIPGPSSLAELTPQTDNWQHSPAAALPTHLRGHDGLRKEGRQTQPNLTCDREPGAWAEIPLIGAQSPSPARKPLSAQPLALRVPAPGSSAGRGPGARVRPSNPPRRRCRARGHSPTTVSRLPAPKGRRRL